MSNNDKNAWPPALKEWVAQCLGKMTDANRAEASAELKKVIGDAYNSETMWEIDWTKVQLQSLQPKPVLPVKRKLAESNNHTGKKAKSALKAAPPVYTDYEEQVALAKRARRFEREHELERQRNEGLHTTGQPSRVASTSHSLSGLSLNGSSNPNWRKQSSSKRKLYSSSRAEDDEPSTYDPNVMDWDRYTIVGRSQELFKHYLRLTSEPDPNTIRPLEVLQRTLAELKQRMRIDKNYPWLCDQFKSLRQDLTVQRIKNEFTVSVYEIHARMALQHGDLVEFNSCISSLRQLYELGIPGKHDEFLAYRILYLVHAKNRSEISRLVGQLTAAQKSSPAVKHALEVQRAVASSNYHSLFVLFNKAPNMGAYVMDHFVVRERVTALMCMGKAYRPGIALTFITSELAFDSVDEANQFLADHNSAVYLDDSLPLGDRIFDGKTAFQTLAQEFETKYRKVGLKGRV